MPTQLSFQKPEVPPSVAIMRTPVITAVYNTETLAEALYVAETFSRSPDIAQVLDLSIQRDIDRDGEFFTTTIHYTEPIR